MLKSRREFLKQSALGLSAMTVGLGLQGCMKKQPYNVLFIAVDDLNDWVGCLGGHPNAKTPHIDKLAEKGMVFEQAYCAAPLCNPSRIAIMTGLRPSTTGMYCNRGWFRDKPEYKDWTTLPQYFRQHGYAAVGGGKLYHHAAGKKSDENAWDAVYQKQVGTPSPPEARRLTHGLAGKFTTTPHFNQVLDWGPIDEPIEETNDWKTAERASQFLQKKHDNPFFLGCGIYRPHLTWYAPKKYFDMHPIEDVALPAYKENDLDDVPAMGKRLARKDFQVIKEGGRWKDAVQGYLACCSFADACIGHVLEGLENSAYRDNTIVMLWGDHGWNLGEKDHWAKFALWEDTNRTPFIIYVPGLNPGRCSRPVSLVDIYPTLIELCGLTPRDDLDGRSLAPLVRQPDQDWPPAVMTHWKDNHAIRDQRYRYIRYRDGGEELYDHENDPHEWTNLAKDPHHAEVKARLADWIPGVNAEHWDPEPPSAM